MKGFYILARGAIQGHHSSLVIISVRMFFWQIDNVKLSIKKILDVSEGNHSMKLEVSFCRQQWTFYAIYKENWVV